jgi:hypothetical protein
MTIDEIIEELSVYEHVPPRSAFREAVEQREALTPYLLKELDYIHEKLGGMEEEVDDDRLAFAALFLLAQFREKRAFPVLTAIMTWNEEALDYFLGDVLINDYGAILCSTYNGDISLLKGIIEDQELCWASRSVALDAYGYITRDGHISRDEMVAYFRSLIGLCQREDDEDLATALPVVVIEEGLKELLPGIHSLYDAELIDVSLFGDYQGFLKCFNEPAVLHPPIHVDDALSLLEKSCDWDGEVPSVETGGEPGPHAAQAAHVASFAKKNGRNDPCPCGSGKKYKSCCLNNPKDLSDEDDFDDDDDWDGAEECDDWEKV